MTTLVGAPVTGISEANGLNSSGIVVGQEDTVFPFFWQPSQPNGTVGTSTHLPILFTGSAPAEATAFSVNNNGDIVGFSDALDASGTSVTRAVLWSGGTIRDLGTLIPDPSSPGNFLGNSSAIDINDSGHIVGSSDSVFGVRHAFLFDPAVGIMRDLGSLVPFSMLPGTPDSSRATSINSNGDIVGVAAAIDATGNVVDRAFLLSAGAFSMVDLGTLIPDPANPSNFLDNSGAFGINDNGMIIGTSDAGAGAGGTLLTGATEFVNGSPPTALLPVHSDGFDNGSADHVVGTFDQPGRGFLFHRTSGLVDLTTLVATAGVTILSATGVNGSGQVTALAEIAGSTVGVLITP